MRRGRIRRKMEDDRNEVLQNMMGDQQQEGSGGLLFHSVPLPEGSQAMDF